MQGRYQREALEKAKAEESIISNELMYIYPQLQLVDYEQTGGSRNEGDAKDLRTKEVFEYKSNDKYLGKGETSVELIAGVDPDTDWIEDGWIYRYERLNVLVYHSKEFMYIYDAQPFRKYFWSNVDKLMVADIRSYIDSGILNKIPKRMGRWRIISNLPINPEWVTILIPEAETNSFLLCIIDRKERKKI